MANHQKDGRAWDLAIGAWNLNTSPLGYGTVPEKKVNASRILQSVPARGWSGRPTGSTTSKDNITIGCLYSIKS
jgi:hypothetical protein